MFNNRCFKKKSKSISNTGYSNTFYFDDNGDKCPFIGTYNYICKECYENNNCKCCSNSLFHCCISSYDKLIDCPYESCDDRCIKVIPKVECEPVLSVTSSPCSELGILENRVRIRDGQLFPLITTMIRGKTIQHINGEPYILLLPNRSYYFSWAMNTAINTRFFNVGAALILDGQVILGGENTTTIPGTLDPRFAFTFAEGIINTGKSLGKLTLEFFSNIGPLESAVTLEIQLIH